MAIRSAKITDGRERKDALDVFRIGAGSIIGIRGDDALEADGFRGMVLRERMMGSV
jgi:hypothetical protein